MSWEWLSHDGTQPRPAIRRAADGHPEEINGVINLWVAPDSNTSWRPRSYWQMIEGGGGLPTTRNSIRTLCSGTQVLSDAEESPASSLRWPFARRCPSARLKLYGLTVIVNACDTDPTEFDAVRVTLNVPVAVGLPETTKRLAPRGPGTPRCVLAARTFARRADLREFTDVLPGQRVGRAGLEPTTPCVSCKCATNCANGPWRTTIPPGHAAWSPTVPSCHVVTHQTRGCARRMPTPKRRPASSHQEFDGVGFVGVDLSIASHPPSACRRSSSAAYPPRRPKRRLA